MLRKRVFKGKITEGRYEGETFSIFMGSTGDKTQIVIGDKDVSTSVASLDIKIRPGKMTELTMIFVERDISEVYTTTVIDELGVKGA